MTSLLTEDMEITLRYSLPRAYRPLVQKRSLVLLQNKCSTNRLAAEPPFCRPPIQKKTFGATYYETVAYSLQATMMPTSDSA